MKRVFLSLLILISNPSLVLAQEGEETFDSLGGNRSLLEKVQALNPEISTSVVQNRFVYRENRFELAPEWGMSLGGDTYVQTQNLGLNAYYHINPQFSVSLKYQQAFNRLTPEGKAMVESAYNQYLQNPADPKGLMPELNYTLNQQVIAVQWYPLYGKISWLGKNVTQFDIYANAGLGSMQLIRGRTQTTQLGGGIGLWLNPTLSLRAEIFWQGYQAQYLNGPRDMNLTQMSLQMGWLL
jgi:outer membrane beta-barrel protein